MESIKMCSSYLFPLALGYPTKWIHTRTTTVLSTRAPKPDSLDPDPRTGFKVVSNGLQTTRTGSRSRALLHAAEARSLDLDRGHMEAKWSLDPECPIYIGSGSKVPCGEPQYQWAGTQVNRGIFAGIFARPCIFHRFFYCFTYLSNGLFCTAFKCFT